MKVNEVMDKYDTMMKKVKETQARKKKKERPNTPYR
jgi:hypothetical protein